MKKLGWKVLKIHPVSRIFPLDEAKDLVDLKAPVNLYERVLGEKQGWLSQVRSEVPLLSCDDGNGVAYVVCMGEVESGEAKECQILW